MSLITSKEMFQFIDAGKFDRETYNRLFAFAQEWKMLEDRAGRLFVIGHVPGYGDLLMDAPMAFAQKFVEECQKADKLIWAPEPVEDCNVLEASEGREG